MNTIYLRSVRTFLPLFIGILLFASCQKSRNDENCTRSMAGIAGSYKLASLKYKATASSPEQDYLMMLDECERDNIIALNANGTYNDQDAGMVCTPNSSDSGTWSLNGNTITSDGIFNGTIQSFDCTTLILYVESTFNPGDKLTFTMVKQ